MEDGERLPASVHTLPAGTATFLLTDVEGSTAALERLGGSTYAAALAEHRAIIRAAFAEHRGVEVDTQGDAFFAAFASARAAVACALVIQDALQDGPLRVRIGLHTGEAEITADGYVGMDVHRAARIAAAAHGGQVLLSTSTRALVDAEVRDLGEHRLKDLAAPEHVYQLGHAAFAPIRSLPRTNLPIPATSLIGRRHELRELTALLGRPDVRLVTLTGAGGSGKTRLAIQAAAEIGDRYPDGVFWVALAPVADAGAVTPAIAHELGAEGDVAAHVGGRQMLLVLDNLEHLLDAAPQLAELLGACPALKLACTSREPLHVAGEWEYAVDPLGLDDAAALFRQRAAAVRRDVELNGEVAAICERVDRLPLAIELAASRVKLLQPAAILERLAHRLPLLAGGPRDAPARQRTLRSTIAWSHELLSRDEQRLFARLSVFVGGCTLEAAESVCDADLDVLGSLVDKSLVRERDGRFRMLETIREFASEQLTASGDEPSVVARMIDWALSVAEPGAPRFAIFSDPLWYRRVQPERHNVVAAADRAVASGSVHRALRLVGALAAFARQPGYLRETRRRAESALSLVEGPFPAEALPVLFSAAATAIEQHDTDSGERWSLELVSLAVAMGDLRAEAMGLCLYGNVHSLRADEAGALSQYDRALGKAEAVDDGPAIAYAAISIADAALNMGEFTQAVAACRRGLERAAPGIAGALHGNLAWGLLGLGRVDEAFAAERAAVGAAAAVSPHSTITYYSMLGVAVISARRGRADLATRLLGCLERWCEELGLGELYPYEQRMRADAIAGLRTQLGEQAFQAAWTAGRAMTAEDAIAAALNE